MSVQGNQVTVSYKWENGRVISQAMDVMGQTMTQTRTIEYFE